MSDCILLDGAFDPLHAGHVTYFTAAAAAFPDYELVVSIAPDDDIRAKGREPLFDQATRATVVGAIQGVDRVILKDQPTEHLLGTLKPAAYVKGADWTDTLPPEQLAACSLYGIQIVFLNTVCASSSDALRRWALRDAERGLDRLEAFIANQRPVTEPWKPVTDYSFEARKQIEGKHPQLIKEVFQPERVLDVGCGPGHLMTLLRDLGVSEVQGLDPNRRHVEHVYDEDIADPMLREMLGWNSSDRAWDLVICREVLEHIRARDIAQAVANLFQLARRYVYITTRFTDRGVFDAATDFDTDPTHITCLSQPFLRALCVLNGGKRRRDLEQKLDHMGKGRVLVYEL